MCGSHPGGAPHPSSCCYIGRPVHPPAWICLLLLRSGGRVTPPPFQIETFCSCCCCRGGSLPRTGYFQVRSVWISIKPSDRGQMCRYVYTSSHLPWGHVAILVLRCNVSLNRVGETIGGIHHYSGKEPLTYCNIGKSLEKQEMTRKDTCNILKKWETSRT